VLTTGKLWKPYFDKICATALIVVSFVTVSTGHDMMSLAAYRTSYKIIIKCTLD